MLVKRISNLFELMEFCVRARSPLPVREIVEEFSWPRPSVFNIVSTLVEHGYLYQPIAREGYYPTTKWMEIARGFADAQPEPESVHKLLVELAKQTGETLFLAAPEGTSVVFVDVVESSADIRFIANVGQRLPIPVTAAGRAILSQYLPAERAATLKRIKYQHYEKDSVMTPESVEGDIEKNAKAGWYVNMGSYSPGVAGIAVPLPFRGRRDAIALGGPASRIDKNIDSPGKLLRKSIDNFVKDNE